MTELFEHLDVWCDAQPRSGAQNMALDQLLMESMANRPLLRVYHWSEPTVSFGYSLPYADAEVAFPDSGLTYIRRWTGGGVVDHRIDVTYTLVIPRANPLATMRGSGSYREIHKVLALALVELGVDVQLISSDAGNGESACFDNPVAYDITDGLNNKVAGAGQRRNKQGLLHQGSVIADVSATDLCEVFSVSLSRWQREYVPADVMLDNVDVLAQERYASEAWLRRR